MVGVWASGKIVCIVWRMVGLKAEGAQLRLQPKHNAHFMRTALCGVHVYIVVSHLCGANVSHIDGT